MCNLTKQNRRNRRSPRTSAATGPVAPRMMESLEGRTLMSASLPGATQLSTRSGGEVVSLELENTMISGYSVAAPRPQTQGIIAILIG